MDTPTNFVVIPNSPRSQPQHVEETSDIRRFLELFETQCVVGCCEWGAIAGTIDEVGAVLELHQLTLAEAQGIIERLLIWNQTINDPVIVIGSGWFWDPKASAQNLRQFSDFLLELSSRMNGLP